MINISRRNRYLLSFLSGALMVLSFPFTGSMTPLVFISWVPLLLLENFLSEKRYRTGKIFIHSYLTFLIYNVGTTWWIWHASAGGAIMAFTLNALLMATCFWLFHVAKRKTGKAIGNAGLLFFWIGFEYLHYHWELSWPWLNLGNTFSILPAAVQWYSVTGVLGGTLWILGVNIFAMELIKKRFFMLQRSLNKKLLLILSLFLIIPLSISFTMYYGYKEMGKPLECVVLQPNIDPYNEKFTGSLDSQLDKLLDLADKKVTPATAMVIAPETAISWGFYEEDMVNLPFYHQLLQRMSKWKNAQLFTGASTWRYFDTPHSRASRKFEDGPGYYESYNSSLLLREKGNFEFLHKSKLVLGVEKVPFSDWLPFLEQLSINNGGTSGTLGVEKEPKVLSSNKLTFAPVICYESIYGGFISEQIKKGAQAIFVITNDGWWKDTPGYKQHMSFARLRAVETRKPVARSANTGTSAFIDQKGDVQQNTGWWVPASIRQTILVNDYKTLYVILGDFLGKMGVVGTIAILILSVIKTFRPEPTKL